MSKLHSAKAVLVHFSVYARRTEAGICRVGNLLFHAHNFIHQTSKQRTLPDETPTQHPD
jgi:hypothetical protein